MRNLLILYLWAIIGAIACVAVGIYLFGKIPFPPKLYELLWDQSTRIRVITLWIDVVFYWGIVFYLGAVVICPIAFFLFDAHSYQPKLAAAYGMLISAAFAVRSLLESNIEWNIFTSIYWTTFYMAEVALVFFAILLSATIGCWLKVRFIRRVNQAS